jgi:hypothetical protein
LEAALARSEIAPRRRRRREFSTTRIELVDMPMAASHGGTNPKAASGMAVRL